MDLRGETEIGLHSHSLSMGIRRCDPACSRGTQKQRATKQGSDSLDQKMSA